MRAVDAVMECLKAEGVDVVFGLPGGANLPTYDAFYDAGIRHIVALRGDMPEMSGSYRAHGSFFNIAEPPGYSPPAPKLSGCTTS